MNHWQMIAISNALPFAAHAEAVALLMRRRRAALRHVQASIDEDAGAGAAGAAL